MPGTICVGATGVAGAGGGKPASDLFKNDPRYSQLGPDGVPTHDATGQLLSPEEQAKLRAQVVAASGTIGGGATGVGAAGVAGPVQKPA